MLKRKSWLHVLSDLFHLNKCDGNNADSTQLVAIVPLPDPEANVFIPGCRIGSLHLTASQPPPASSTMSASNSKILRSSSKRRRSETPLTEASDLFDDQSMQVDGVWIHCIKHTR